MPYDNTNNNNKIKYSQPYTYHNKKIINTLVTYFNINFDDHLFYILLHLQLNANLSNIIRLF